jgi:tetratricopeptide (TPR) repeat protein
MRELPVGGSEGNGAYQRYFAEQIEALGIEFGIGRHEKATEIWRRMYTQFPDLCLKSEKAFNLLIDLGLHDEADRLIHEGSRRYPRNEQMFAVLSARVAYQKGDFEEAIRRCETVRRKFSRTAASFLVAADCLFALGRPDEAEAMLWRGVQKLPKSFELSMRYAQAATRRLDWPEGLRRWQVVQRNFNYLPGPLGVAECLCQLDRMAEAEHTLIEACEHFPDNAWSFAELAAFPTIKGDHEEALRRWDVVRERFPSFDHALIKSAEAMRAVGREADAEELLRMLVKRAPFLLAGQLEYARSADRRGDRAAAAERWASVYSSFPDCAEASQRVVATASAAVR